MMRNEAKGPALEDSMGFKYSFESCVNFNNVHAPAQIAAGYSVDRNDQRVAREDANPIERLHSRDFVTQRIRYLTFRHNIKVGA